MVETNGTLLDDSMKEWFSANRGHITLSLSLDGAKFAHDLNRCNSYEDVAKHLSFCRDNWPEQPVKMTIGPQTIDWTFDGVLHVHDLGLRAEFDVIFDDVWGDAESERRAVRVWAEQLQKLVSFYHTRPGLPRPSALSRRLDRLFVEPSSDNSAFCGAGKHVTCFTPDELEYPCFRFAPLVVDSPLFNVRAAPVLENEQCTACPFARICPTCEGNNYAVTGSCFKRTSFHCRLFKVSLLASARMHLLDHPEVLRQPPEDDSREEKLRRMRMLVVIRLVNDLCSPILEWASMGSGS